MQVESANLGGIHKICKRNPQIVSEFRILFITELAYEQLKDIAGILICNNLEFKLSAESTNKSQNIG